MKSSRLIAFAVVLLFASVAFCSLSASAEGAMIWTDKQDYAPEETVTIYGSGFIPGSIIGISVTRPDGVVDTWSTMSDESGLLVTTYLLDGITGTYDVSATDGTNTATTTFSDGPLVYSPTRYPAAGDVDVAPGGSSSYDLTITADSGTNIVYNPGPFSAIEGYTVLPTGWLSFLPSSLTLSSGGSGTTTVTITVPLDATPGVYATKVKFNPATTPASAPGSGTDVYVEVVGFQSFKVCGYKNDTSGNNLDNWDITLTKVGGGSWTVKTGDGSWADGYYEFIITSVGDYTISETLQTGWTRISPAADYTFTATSGHADIKGRDFVNFQWATITVTKHDTEENPLDGWDVAIDGPGEDDDQSGATGDDGAGSGAVTFTVKHPGDFTVSETLKNGWTAISSDTNPVSVASGGTYTFDFVNFQNVVVTVNKHDTEGRDVADWEIYLDGPGDAAFGVPHEQTETTDANGQVAFTITAPGDYRITEESKSGWTAVSPTLHDFTAVSGGSYGPYTFVNFEWLTISGNKYEYAGGYCTSFDDLVGWTTYSGTWSIEGGELSGQSSGAEAWIWNDKEFSGDTSIQWRMKFLSTPTDGVGRHGGIMSFSTTQTQRWSSSGYTIDWIDRLSDHGFRIYKWTGGSYSLLGILGGDFELIDGQWYVLKVEMVGPKMTLYVDGVLMGSATDGGVPYTSGYVGFWLYSNGEHAHFDDLCVMDISQPLSGWDMLLYKDGAPYASTTTDGDGYYEFTVIDPGTYSVAEVLKTGWTATCPVHEVGSYSATEEVVGHSDIVVQSGTDIDCKDFWNFEWASVQVVKEDTEGNKLAGWTINLAGPDAQSGDTSGAGGSITFTVKEPGGYTVTEVLKSGWTQIGETSFQFTAESGGSYGPYTFVNFEWVIVSGYKYEYVEGFCDDFESETLGESASKWTSISGVWRIETDGSQVYSVDRTASPNVQAIAVAGDLSWTDYIMQYRFKIRENGIEREGSVFVRADSNAQNGYLVHPQVGTPDTGHIALWKRAGGVDTKVATAYAGIMSDTWYLVTVVVQGNSIRVYVDGSPLPVIDYTDGSSPFLSGLIGLRLYDNRHAHYDDICVVPIVDPSEGWPMKIYKDGSLYDETTTGGDGYYEFEIKDPGDYAIKEVLPTGWTSVWPVQEVGPDSGDTEVHGYAFNVVSGKDVPDRIFINFEWATIAGTKTEYGGGGLSGWTIRAVCGATVYSVETDSNGDYLITLRLPGHYDIVEVLKGGWTMTLPSEYVGSGSDEDVVAYADVIVGSGDTLTEKDFENFKWLTISGMKFEDIDGDGCKEAGEPALSGWVIRLYDELDDLYDSDTTDANGEFSILVKEPGTYSVRELLRKAWTITHPVYQVGSESDDVEVTGYSGIDVASGTDVPCQDFGNFEWLTISGHKYEYGICDDFEDGDASGWTPVNGIWTVVDDSGNMVYMQSLPYYIPGVRVAGEATWTDYVIQAKVKVTGTDWGRWGGLLFRVSDPGTDGTAGTYYELYLQENGNLQLVKTVSGARTGIVHPFVGLFYDEWWYIKAEVIGGHIRGKAWEVGTPELATWIVDYTDPSPIASGKIGLITFSNVPDQPVLFDDVCLKVPLEGWHLKLFSGSAQVGDDAVTGADGGYSFTVKEPGTYSVKEVLPTGWTELLPEVHYGDGSAVLGYDGITASSGTDITGKDFVNFEWLTISGTKFFDANGNGEKDAGEPGLQYWVIKLFRGSVQYGSSATTAADGSYSFLVKDPGIYSIKEVLKPWWIMTHPAAGGPSLVPELVDGFCGIAVMSGTDMDCMDFGNWLGSSSIVTTSGLCLFDYDDSTDGRQFKLIFTPDVPTNPSLYRLTASNPGQFYYNVFFVGDVEVGDEFTIYLPFPFVTQGAVPVHVYSSLNTGPYGCLIPVGDITYKFDVAPQTIGLEGSYDVFGDYAEITLTATESLSGFVYIAVHLDYGLKKSIGGLSVGSSNQAIGSLTIFDQNVYVFGAEGPEGFVTDDEVKNMNVFKRDPGFGGLVLDSNGDPVEGATVKIFTSAGVLLGTVVTDEDGWYMFYYKHKGKSAAYMIQMSFSSGGEDYADQETVTVKANSFALVNFTLPIAVPKT